MIVCYHCYTIARPVTLRLYSAGGAIADQYETTHQLNIMEEGRRHSLKHRRTRRRESSFVIDGNRKDFEPPVYQPLLDKHLQMFFLRENRLNILRHNRLINRRYEVIDRSTVRPATAHRHSRSFDRPNALTHSNTMGGSSNLPHKDTTKLEKPVLVGYESLHKRSRHSKPSSNKQLNVTS